MKILEARQLDAFLRRRRVALDRAEAIARPIIEDVRKRGDKAVREYALKFDKWDGPLRLEVGSVKVAPELQRALQVAARNIEKFARLQKPKAWMKTIAPGVRAGQAVIPLASVGCYAPGGRFPLPSTVLMTAIPARVAGVAHVAVACPRAPEVVIAAARLAGVDALYPIGGVQAIAAMAYGTRTIARVDRIVGPGSLYVTAAKKIVAAETGIDFIAGPTEIVLVADAATAPRADWIAADMLAQAEHDPAAVSIFLTPSRTLAESVAGHVGESKNCAAVITRTLDEAMDLSNRIAPEHLWISDASLLQQVTSAGSIFVGPYSAVAAGDYATGPNHTLPTGGGAHVRGGLSVTDYLKIVTVQSVSATGLARLAPAITTLARAEGLEYHARSVEARSQEKP